jgi:hypothetical protein
MTWPMDQVVVVGQRCHDEYQHNKSNTGECEGFEPITKQNPEPIDYKIAADHMMLHQYNEAITTCAQAIRAKQPLSSDCKLIQKYADAGRKKLESK